MTAARLETPPTADAPRAVAPRAIGQRLALSAALAAGIGVAGWLSPLAFRHLDYFHLQRVELVGARYLPPTEVAAALGADTSASVFGDTDAYAARVATLPLVATASVERKLPGTLVVRIAERTPVALVAADGGLRAVDTAGTVLPIDPVATPVDAPVIGAPGGAADRGADRRLLGFLGLLRAQDPALFDVIESARRAGPDEWQFRSTHGTLVRTSPEVTVARLATIFPVEQDLRQRRLQAAELDLRFRNLVIARLP